MSRRDIPMTWRVYSITNGQSTYDVFTTPELVEIITDPHFTADEAMAIVPEKVQQ